MTTSMVDEILLYVNQNFQPKRCNKNAIPGFSLPTLKISFEWMRAMGKLRWGNGSEVLIHVLRNKYINKN